MSDPLPPKAPPRADGLVTSGLQQVHDLVAPLTDGHVADYIPQLAVVDPDQFGIALCSIDGHVYGVGDFEVEFTIQSISKAFVYALALGDRGIDGVLARVGVEPSGEAFNAIKLEPGTGRPPNPMVNAGAILTTSLIEAADAQQRFGRIADFLSACAGRRLEVDQAVYRSEYGAADRNRALAWLMTSAGSFTEPVEEVLDVYCQQCALSVTAADLAVMATTLANGGVNPVTKRQVMDPMIAVRTLSVMATCGMYDYSGEWLLRVGLPAKSGVGGGLISASPAEFGIGVFSPRLDEIGNTVRGIAVARAIADQFDVHMMERTGASAPSVSVARQVDTPVGPPVVLLAAQGSLGFAATERLVWAMLEQLGEDLGQVSGMVLDLRRVTRVHPIGEAMLNARLSALIHEGLRVVLVRPEGISLDVEASETCISRPLALGLFGATPPARP